jgi:autoinducer 2 (AI-2) kinase
MRHLLALDAGTGSGRAVIFDETGTQLAAAGREWNHLEEPQYPGSMNFDVEQNWQHLVACIQEVSAQVPDLNIAAISTTSMREGIVLLDEDNREMWACANVDSRAIQEVHELRALRPGIEHEMYLRSGQTLALGAAPRLRWIQRHRPDVYERAVSMVMLSDWVSVRLGARPSVDPSNGGTTGLLNLSQRDWDPEIAHAYEIDSKFLSAPVVEAGTVIGEVSSSVAEATGLKAGTPIVMGGGDALLGAIGVGVVRPGQTAVLGGTFWQQMVMTDHALEDPSGRIRINFHAIPNMWEAEAIVFFPGFAARWFRDAMTPDIKEQAAREKVDPYSLLEAMASTVPPGSNGIIPIFSDAMNYSRWRHAAPSFLNLTVDPQVTSRAAMFRSLQENAAIVSLANLKQISSITGAFPSEVVFASGASKGPVWCQILADVLQVVVRTPVVKEATSLGAVICAGIGVGVYPSFAEASTNLVQIDHTYEPNPANADVYAYLLERWTEAYAAQLDLADRGVTKSMWRAPGE